MIGKGNFFYSGEEQTLVDFAELPPILYYLLTCTLISAFLAFQSLAIIFRYKLNNIWLRINTKETVGCQKHFSSSPSAGGKPTSESFVNCKIYTCSFNN